MNRLLAWDHAKALETLLEKVSYGLAIADQFGDEQLILNALQENGRTIMLGQRHKTESDLAVAAASILARAEFLLRLKRLSDGIGTTLPKGASPAVELAGRMIVKKHGEERLGPVAKLHFKNDSGRTGGNGLNRLADLKNRALVGIGPRMCHLRNLPIPVEHPTTIGAGLKILRALHF